MVEAGTGRRRGFRLLLEGKNGEGWFHFVLELRCMVKYKTRSPIAIPLPSSQFGTVSKRNSINIPNCKRIGKPLDNICNVPIKRGRFSRHYRITHKSSNYETTIAI